MTNNNHYPLQPVFDFLETNSLADLREKHGVRFHVKGHLVTLAYDQFEAKITNDLTNLCRGLVIAREDGNPVVDVTAPFGKVRLLAFPFVRFFNYGQVDAKFNKPTAILEKLDGTLSIVYYDPFKDSWNVATRNVPDGSNVANDGAGKPFRLLFEKAILDSYPNKFACWEDFGNALNKNFTYVFELMTPENIVVVRHDTYKAALIGCRDLRNGKELRVEVAAIQLGLDYPTSYTNLVQNFIDFDQIVKLANLRDPLKNEGYVVVGPNFERLKIKSEKYVTYNKVHDLTKYDVINYLLTGEIDDYTPLMVDYQKQMVADLSIKVADWARNTNHALNELRAKNNSFESKKDLALYINTNEIYKRHGRAIFRAFDLDGNVSNVPEIQAIVKDQYLDKNTGRYQDSFLRTLMNEWL